MSDTAIAVSGLIKRFGDQLAVRGIDLEVGKGEIVAFVGPNGSGKTTTIRMLCGLLTPDGGEGHCLGFDIRREYDAIKEHVGYMSQGFGLYSDLTVRENLGFSASIHQLDARQQKVEAALHEFQLQHYANHLAGTLSGGWKQRLSLACALMHEPELLLLDEPTGGVDPESRRSFWHIIRQKSAQGVAVLVSTHYLDEVELYSDRLAYIHTGTMLASGTMQEVIKQSSLVAFRLPGVSTALLETLEKQAAVSMAEVLAGGVKVTGPDRMALERCLNDFGLLTDAEAVAPTLEDLFFYLARHHRQLDV
ncbi:ABC transporter ATP-binding protein [Mariprofundus erugo]|uniref:ABC transporter ATP-binding protein n=1 Tax=Mariprofundus erugo TaxID=2528639 RepID=A0A5R9GK29_9PROT|nr:ABC transporter ATP-binding protein [Mariprofundus erugo]TLS66158.1 ABC transporter ATP-binding protein [Mariprofundus erugo]